jgi:hypothetical protein
VATDAVRIEKMGAPRISHNIWNVLMQWPRKALEDRIPELAGDAVLE